MFAPNEDQWRKDLRTAAQLLREEGWCQGKLRGEEGRCIVGALRDATGGMRSESYGQAHYRISRRLEDYIPVWNDALGRTKEEVINLLESVANEYE